MTEEAKTARREYMRRWRNENRDHIRSYMKEWRAEHKKQVSETNSRYWQGKAERGDTD